MNFLAKISLQQLSQGVGKLPQCLTPLCKHLPAAGFHSGQTALGTFEPDYLDTEGSTIPTYPPLNIQLKGYNFDVLEEYQSWVHRMAENMGIDVSLAWATPAQSLDLTTYHVGGIRPKDTFNVQLYERNVQVANLRSIDAPVLLDVIQKALPEGVTLRIAEHTVEAAEARWIADPFIDQLRSELAEKAEGKEAEAEKRKQKLEEKAARKREMLLKSLTE